VRIGSNLTRADGLGARRRSAFTMVGEGGLALWFLRHLNHIALHVTHLEVVRSLLIPLNFSNIHATRTQDFSRLLDVGSVQHWRSLITRFVERAENEGGLIFLRET